MIYILYFGVHKPRHFFIKCKTNVNLCINSSIFSPIFLFIYFVIYLIKYTYIYIYIECV